MTASIQREEDGNAPLMQQGGGNSESTESGTGTSDGPPDGGWGWVVVGAGFVAMLLIDGTVGLFGLLYPAILDNFKASPSLTAMTGSIQVGAYPTVGVLAAMLIHRYGCRRVGLVGGLLSASGLALSVLAPNIGVFILFYGAVTGVGFGLSYLPALVSVSLYFDRKRGVALGVVSAGSGLGILALAPLCQFLMDTYGHKGAILVVAGIVLNLCVCAALLTPPRSRSRASSRTSLSQSSSAVMDDAELSQWVKQLEGVDGNRMSVVRVSRVHTPTSDLPEDELIAGSPDLVGVDAFGKQTSVVSTSRVDTPRNDLSDKAVADSPSIQTMSTAEVSLKPSQDDISADTGSPGSRRRGSVLSARSAASSSSRQDEPGTPTPEQLQGSPRPRRLSITFADETTVVYEYEDLEEGEPSYAMSGNPGPSNAHPSEDLETVETTYHSHKKKPSLQRSVLRYSSREGITMDTSTPIERYGARAAAYSLGEGKPWRSYAGLPLMRPDPYRRAGEKGGVFHSMEGLNYPRKSSTARKCDKVHQDLLFQSELAGHHHSRHCHHPGPTPQTILLGASMISLGLFKSQSIVGDHVSEVAAPGVAGELSPAASVAELVKGGVWLLVRDPAFLALCLASALIQLGCMVPMFFIADYVENLGLGRERAALLIAIYGVCNMVGRLAAGGLATLKQVHVLGLHCLGLAVAGVACLLLPLCTSVALLIAFSVVFGVFIGFFPPLQPMLLVDYFSLEQLTSSLGLLSMVKGIATIVGPPIAGAIYELNKNYGHSFLASGAVLVLSAVIHLLMPVARRLHRQKAARAAGICNGSGI